MDGTGREPGRMDEFVLPSLAALGVILLLKPAPAFFVSTLILFPCCPVSLDKEVTGNTMPLSVIPNALTCKMD